MRVKRVIILAAALLVFLPAWSLAQGAVRVAVLPFTVHSAEDLSYLRDGIWDIISSRIIVEGEIEVVEKSLVTRFLPDLRGEVTDQGARWLGARVGADYTIYGSITKVGEYISLDAKVVHVPGTRPTSSAFAQHQGMDEVMTKVDTFAQDLSNRILGRSASYERGGPGQLRQYLMFQALGYTKLQTFPQRVLKGVDAGDVDGDGKNEIVVMDHHQLWIYRDEGKALKLIIELPTSTANDFLTLDVIDINGDDRAEICITNSLGNTLQSFILAYEGDSFRYLASNLNWYLRVVRIPEKGMVLAAQRLGHPEDFTGPLRLVRMKGDKVKIGKKIKQGKKGTLPKKVDWLLTFTSGKFTSPDLQEFLVMTDYGGKGKLRLLDTKGDVQWKSSDKFGGSDTYLDRPDVHVDEKGGAIKDYRRIYLPPRMVAKDLDGDGMDEVVTVINEFSSGEHIEKLRFYSKGYVTGLTWDGMGLAQAWRTQDISGYVADFQLKDVDNDGRDEVVTASVSPYFFKKEARGTLAVYELYE